MFSFKSKTVALIKFIPHYLRFSLSIAKGKPLKNAK